jgi:hypothetical protein
MQAIEIVNQLKDRKGQHVQVTWQRVCKTLKSAGNVIIAKRTTAWVRSGISFANLTSIREGIEQGKREPVEGLPWGNWREGYANYIIDHRDTEYVRLYPASFDNLSHPSVEWTLDGQPSKYEDVETFLLSSERRNKEDERPLCFTVKADSIIAIGA